MDKRFIRFDFLPGKIKVRLINFDKRQNIFFGFEWITVDKITKAVGITTNKIDSLTRHVDFF